MQSFSSFLLSFFNSFTLLFFFFLHHRLKQRSSDGDKGAEASLAKGNSSCIHFQRQLQFQSQKTPFLLIKKMLINVPVLLFSSSYLSFYSQKRAKKPDEVDKSLDKKKLKKFVIRRRWQVGGPFLFSLYNGQYFIFYFVYYIWSFIFPTNITESRQCDTGAEANGSPLLKNAQLCHILSPQQRKKHRLYSCRNLVFSAQVSCFLLYFTFDDFWRLCPKKSAFALFVLMSVCLFVCLFGSLHLPMQTDWFKTQLKVAREKVQNLTLNSLLL